MTDKIIYNVETDRFVDMEELGLSGGISFKRLAGLLQFTQCSGSERLTTIIVEPGNHMITLRFKEGQRT